MEIDQYLDSEGIFETTFDKVMSKINKNLI